MADNNDVRAKLMKQVAAGRIVDFSELGRALAEIGPDLFKEVSATSGPETVATDYVVWGVSSVVHAWHDIQGETGQLGDPAILAQALRNAGVNVSVEEA